LHSPLRTGIELFNAGRYYDAHESLEDAWRECAGPEKLYLQGLTQAAVALHHFSTGNLVGARSVLARAIGNLHAPQGALPIDTPALLAQLETCSAALRNGTIPPPPQIQQR